MSDKREFTLSEALEIGKRNDPGAGVSSVSRSLIAEIERLEAELATLRARLDAGFGTMKEAYQAGFIESCKWNEPATQDSDSLAVERAFNLWCVKVGADKSATKG